MPKAHLQQQGQNKRQRTHAYTPRQVAQQPQAVGADFEQVFVVQRRIGTLGVPHIARQRGDAQQYQAARQPCFIGALQRFHRHAQPHRAHAE